MNATGIVRKLDQLGRITLPKELRRTFDIQVGDALEIFTDEDRLILKKYNPADIFTGACEDLVEYNGIRVSRETIKELAKAADIKLT